MEENIVYIGRKPPTSYVLAVMRQFREGADEVKIKARGKAINRAVDVVEITKSRFLSDIEIEDIQIGTEEVQRDDESIKLSTIEITLKVTKEQ